MKYSAAMLRGYKLIGGVGMTEHHWQTKDGFKQSLDRPDDPKQVVAACVNGAALLGARAEPWGDQHHRWLSEFAEAWGAEPQQLNNDGLPWEHVYGMARAAGL